MRKAQFVSPIIILAIILISFYILWTENNIDQSMQSGLSQESRILSDINDVAEQDLEFQNNLTTSILALASTTDSSGTLITAIESNYTGVVTGVSLSNGILVNYTNAYTSASGNYTKEISSTILVPYPYAELANLVANFDASALKGCISTCNSGTCISDYGTCLNNLYGGAYNWKIIGCACSNPIQLTLQITSSAYPLTTNYPFFATLLIN